MKRHDKQTHDESAFYQHWHGKRTRIANVVTSDEVDSLEDMVAPFDYGYAYFGPILGTSHVYREHAMGLDWDKDRRRQLQERARREAHAEKIALRSHEPLSTLDIKCRACGHERRLVIARSRAWELAGKRFVCSQCGTKSAPFLPRCRRL
jgi:predicted RNA-binding Zn-ribbon protein involved in translation (DUF1610 family)